ncbi:SPOR domain-containing protein [Litorilituus lipolyticus]|uniref:SPOR domain-containing protein n=1 Tax=Litorilituus lipolyticus TaxID=2491017 RepID=A0A502KU70_9GAMM|nr:hypothetical protein [Litorilituus lipolyticus]TPH15198.1 hypothetical protein EPA86_10310 [Litorilituus lipolyticus]
MSAAAIELQSTQHNDVTSISVSARIDYILRFSKHLTLVVDENTQQYTSAASQFLGTLDHQDNSLMALNVAYISASTKLNDIQMRCRIIEQLFSNTLFDPEQSLVVSITKLAKNHKQAITIVIEHAQSLSLQLKYELTQLVSINSKNNLTINVVLFGSTAAAEEIKTNKSLFKGKLSILDGKTGQLIGLSSTKIKTKAKDNNQLKHKIVASVLAIVVLISLASFYLLSSHSALTFADLPKVKEPAKENNKVPLPNELVKGDKIEILAVQQDKNSAKVEEKVVNLAENKLAVKQDIASALDINNALMQIAVNAEPQIPAQVNDIIDALNVATQEEKKKIISVEAKSEYDEQYYLTKNQGYVIQIAGFSKVTLWQGFILANPMQELYSYQRELNNDKLIVVTSMVYASMNEAKMAMESMPESIKQRNPWIKPIATIKREIATFN